MRKKLYLCCVIANITQHYSFFNTNNMEKETKKLSKAGEWLASNHAPVFDMASLSEKEYKSAMRAIMR